MRVLRADWVCPVSGPPIADGYVVVDGDRIVRVETTAPEGPVEDFPGCALIPGFVNTHTHLELTVMRGFLENLPFASWIRQLTWTKYECLDRDDLAVSARLGALECLEAGVTCVGEVMDIGTGWDAMRETGLRGVAYQEVFGPGEESAEGSAADLRRKIKALVPEQSDLQRLGVSPHAPYTVSQRLYGLVREIAEVEELAMAVHVAESADETLFVRDAAGPEIPQPSVPPGRLRWRLSGVRGASVWIDIWGRSSRASWRISWSSIWTLPRRGQSSIRSMRSFFRRTGRTCAPCSSVVSKCG